MLKPTLLLPHAKMLLVPIRFFLASRLCSGGFYVLTEQMWFSPLSLSAPSPLPLTRPISSSLREFQHGAFASKNIRAPKQNACTAGKNINWFGEVSFDIQVYSTSICSLVFTKIQSSLLQNQIVSVIKFWVRNNYDWKKEPILNNFIPYTTRPPQWGFIGLPTAPF